ncbi:MAG TPA: 2-amino-4-hydroxy-6-hydroxymethyldihydropteridine diphosphokinase [Armatimonadota bacterium]|jgi:2-amino-4-hydroxy-6-hydroxymethyldihydropteridine diphosphokinase
MAVRAYLSLGSNLGKREALLREAIARIGQLPGTRIVAESPLLETAPWGNTDQPAFLNLALAIETTLTPEALLDGLRAIEDALGRQRTEHWGPRTVDIDILVYDGVTRDTSTLRLPHPYLTERLFVLQPLAEIAPDLVVHGQTVRAWLDLLLRKGG